MCADKTSKKKCAECKCLPVKEFDKELKTFDEYQTEAMKTAKSASDYPHPSGRLINAALGIIGEAGEIVEPVKKYLAGTRGLDVDKMREEVGGVLWYIAELCEVLGITMQECAEYNIKQLRKRHGEKYSGYGNRDAKTGGA